MLAVTVDLDGDVVAVLEREAVAGLNGSADAEIEGETHDVGAAVGRDAGGPVGRAVVHDDNVEAGIESADLVDDAAHGRFLVQRGNDRDALELHQLIVERHSPSMASGPDPLACARSLRRRRNR